MAVTALEWAGALFGIAGAFLLATNSRVSRYGWFAFLAADVTMGTFALLIDRNGLLFQQVGFTATTLLGIYRCRGARPSAPIAPTPACSCCDGRLTAAEAARNDRLGGDETLCDECLRMALGEDPVRKAA